MNNNKITPQETLQIHELITLKNLSLTKTVTMLPLVKNPDLKKLMENEVQTTKTHIEDLKNIIDNNLQNN